MHTVGIGKSEEDRKNAHLILDDGKHYIIGIGGYEGKGTVSGGSLQEVVNGKQDKLTAGAGITIDKNNNISINFDPEVFKVVTELPASPAEGDERKIHLVSSEDTESGNAYDEYVYVDGSWEKIGSFRPTVDLLDYAKTADIPVEKGSGYHAMVQKVEGVTASGQYASAFGLNTKAPGDSAHVEGWQSESWGVASHAEGVDTIASGNASHTEGQKTEARNKAEHAEGRYNVSIKDKTIHTVGIGAGTSETDRKNAHEIHNDGKHYIYGIGGYDGTNSQTEGVKPVQEVISSLEFRIAELENIISQITIKEE